MGLFSNWKFKKKSDAYSILQRYFERYSPLYGVNIDSRRDAYELVENACRDSPDLVDAKLHRITLSAVTLVYGMDNCYQNGAQNEARFFLHCLGQILIDIESEYHDLKLSGTDIRILNNCSESYKEFSIKLDDGVDFRY